MNKVKEEAFELNRDVLGYNLSENDITVVSGQGMQDIWSFQVPVGQILIFSYNDTFSAYLEDSTTTECSDGSFIAIDKADSSKQSRSPILTTVRYKQVKEFQDVDKFLHLDIKASSEVIINEGEWVIIKGNVNTTLDASDSYFKLSCKLIRKTLF